mmetsp:Transcript_20388/g.29586  ORF Transcript_20388/g.29586 Transcript_20388/m.29586 type:complete len:111 (-) Transcript_20388:94-426(-)
MESLRLEAVETLLRKLLLCVSRSTIPRSGEGTEVRGKFMPKLRVSVRCGSCLDSRRNRGSQQEIGVWLLLLLVAVDSRSVRNKLVDFGWRSGEVDCKTRDRWEPMQRICL